MRCINTLVLWVCALTVLPAQAQDWQVGDHAYLCLQRDLHPNWPEYFAIKVEITAIENQKARILVVEDYPMPGRTNEEETPVKGHRFKVSFKSLYSAQSAEVVPGERFHGKPVCRALMVPAPASSHAH